jgi:hypothetical protein
MSLQRASALLTTWLGVRGSWATTDHFVEMRQGLLRRGERRILRALINVVLSQMQAAVPGCAIRVRKPNNVTWRFSCRQRRRLVVEVRRTAWVGALGQIRSDGYYMAARSFLRAS